MLKVHISDDNVVTIDYTGLENKNFHFTSHDTTFVIPYLVPNSSGNFVASKVAKPRYWDKD